MVSPERHAVVMIQALVSSGRKLQAEHYSSLNLRRLGYDTVPRPSSDALMGNKWIKVSHEWKSIMFYWYW